MRGLLALVMVSSLLAGCRSQSSTVNNPFLGRTTVPPPGTGLQAPYFQPQQGATTPLMPPTVTPGSAAPLGSTGGWNAAGSSTNSTAAAGATPSPTSFRANSGGVVQIDSSVRAASAEVQAAATDLATPAPVDTTPAAGSLPAGGGASIRIPTESEADPRRSVPPTTTPSGVTPTSFRMTLPEPASASPITPVESGALREITDLPPARTDRSIRDSRAVDRIYR